MTSTAKRVQNTCMNLMVLLKLGTEIDSDLLEKTFKMIYLDMNDYLDADEKEALLMNKMSEDATIAENEVPGINMSNEQGQN